MRSPDDQSVDQVVCCDLLPVEHYQSDRSCGCVGWLLLVLSLLLPGLYHVMYLPTSYTQSELSWSNQYKELSLQPCIRSIKDQQDGNFNYEDLEILYYVLYTLFIIAEFLLFLKSSICLIFYFTISVLDLKLSS